MWQQRLQIKMSQCISVIIPNCNHNPWVIFELHKHVTRKTKQLWSECENAIIINADTTNPCTRLCCWTWWMEIFCNTIYSLIRPTKHLKQWPGLWSMSSVLCINISMSYSWSWNVMEDQFLKWSLEYIVYSINYK